MQFASEAMFPVAVKVSVGLKPQAEQEVGDDKPFKMAVDLPPGTYMLQSEPKSKEGREKYWGAIGPRFHIEVDGALTYASDQEMVHSLKMKILAPAMLAKVEANRPVLKWEAVPGETEYSVGWIELMPSSRKVMKSGQAVKTVQPQYQFEEDVAPKRLYEWYIHASNAEGKQLAHGDGYFLSTGTDLKDMQQAKGPPLPTPAPGTGWLGVSVREQSEASSKVFFGGEAGLEVIDFVPGSPASRSGLSFGDLIVKVDDKAVSEVGAFITQISSIAPETKVQLTVWRLNKGKMTVTVVVGKRPASVAKNETPKKIEGK